MILARARVPKKNYDACGAFSWCKPAQILIVEAKKRRQEVRVFFGRACWMDSPFQLSITAGLITAQFGACCFTKDPCNEICPF